MLAIINTTLFSVFLLLCWALFLRILWDSFSSTHQLNVGGPSGFCPRPSPCHCTLSHGFGYYLHVNNCQICISRLELSCEPNQFPIACLLFPVRYCIIFLLLHNWLLHTQGLKPQIYYLMVFMGQEPRHGLAGSSAQHVTRLKSKWCLGCVLIWRLNWGKNPLPNSLRLLV